jgi:hypothetical protein
VKQTLEPRFLPGLDLEFRLCGGATDSLFPQVEAALLGDLEAQEALFYVAESKSVRRYWSLMDFAFCEIFPEHRGKCRAYYEAGGASLREMLSEVEEWRFYNRVMIEALAFAKAAYRLRRRAPWCRFVGILKQAVKQSQN